jgi:hypothetical protein
MEREDKMLFSQIKNDFHGRRLPEDNMTLAGCSAVINYYELAIPLPDVLSAVSTKHKKYEVDQWSVFTPRHKPDDTLQGHLFFALKYEAIDLAFYNALFVKIERATIKEIILSEPTGKHSRRLWFLYEFLTQTELDIPNSEVTNYVDLLDSEIQFIGTFESSKRHRVKNNLLGVLNFCPTIRRTKKLNDFVGLNLKEKAKAVLGSVHPDVLARASAFLLLKDSKASYAIEGETPPHNRAERWGRAIGQAGQQPLTEEEFVRLQKIVIEDTRFIKMGFRIEGGFIGEHDRQTNIPIPDHVSAKWQDLTGLIGGLIATSEKAIDESLDPVLLAAIIAFGFVFIHPFEDGNGRLHRYLIHHVLAEKGFAQKGIVFPVSAVILENIDEYRKVLEAYSKPRIDFIEWKPTPKGNVEVVNETIDLYRYFDATRQVEFLYECVEQTVNVTLPNEVDYLGKHDKLKSYIQEYFEMPDRTVSLLINFLHQGHGKLSKRAKEKEFSELNDVECRELEGKFTEIFG